MPDYGRWREHTNHLARRNHILWDRNRRLWERNYVLRDRNPFLYRRHMNLFWRFYHRPGWYRPYTPYRHTSWLDILLGHHRNWYYPAYYHYTLPFRSIYWWNWVRVRVALDNGYRVIDGYPYYVYDGYSHRYSNQDLCDYELVDGYGNNVIKTFHGWTCQQGYDACAIERDNLNWNIGNAQYFCSERFKLDPNYDYQWNLDEDYYSDLQATDVATDPEYQDYDAYDDYENDYTVEDGIVYDNGFGPVATSVEGSEYADDYLAFNDDAEFLEGAESADAYYEDGTPVVTDEFEVVAAPMQ